MSHQAFITAMLYARGEWSNILKKLKETKYVLGFYIQAKRLSSIIATTVFNIQEFRKCCSPQLFLKNLLESKFQVPQMTREGEQGRGSHSPRKEHKPETKDCDVHVTLSCCTSPNLPTSGIRVMLKKKKSYFF